MPLPPSARPPRARSRSLPMALRSSAPRRRPAPGWPPRQLASANPRTPAGRYRCAESRSWQALYEEWVGRRGVPPLPLFADQSDGGAIRERATAEREQSTRVRIRALQLQARRVAVKSHVLDGDSRTLIAVA